MTRRLEKPAQIGVRVLMQPPLWHCFCFLSPQFLILRCLHSARRCWWRTWPEHRCTLERPRPLQVKRPQRLTCWRTFGNWKNSFRTTASGCRGWRASSGYDRVQQDGIEMKIVLIGFPHRAWSWSWGTFRYTPTSPRATWCTWMTGCPLWAALLKGTYQAWFQRCLEPPRGSTTKKSSLGKHWEKIKM